MVGKLRFPVSFKIRGLQAKFKGADNLPIFSIEASNKEDTTYCASAVCRALNSHHNLVRDVRDSLKIIDSMTRSLGIDPKQRARLSEIQARLDFLTKGKQNVN